MTHEKRQFTCDQCEALFRALESAAKEWDQGIYEFMEGAPKTSFIVELVQQLNDAGYVISKRVDKETEKKPTETPEWLHRQLDIAHETIMKTWSEQKQREFAGMKLESGAPFDEPCFNPDHIQEEIRKACLYGFQQCHICRDWTCCDNSNPEKQ
jgi:hypothetical protein